MEQRAISGLAHWQSQPCTEEGELFWHEKKSPNSFRGRRLQGSTLGHSGSSEPGPSAEHPLQDPWRNIELEHSRRVHHSFRFGGFRCFKALSKRPRSVISVDFLREEKTAQNVRPSENRRHAILPRILLFKESIVKTWGSNAPSVHFQCRRHVRWM